MILFKEFSNWQNYFLVTEFGIGVTIRVTNGALLTRKWHRDPSGVMTKYCILIWLVITLVYTWVKIDQTQDLCTLLYASFVLKNIQGKNNNVNMC